jgi:hypothetical protein
MISEEVIDGILSDTFPASDPPSWTLGIEERTHIDPSEHETQRLEIPDGESKDLQPDFRLCCPRVPDNSSVF